MEARQSQDIQDIQTNTSQTKNKSSELLILKYMIDVYLQYDRYLQHDRYVSTEICIIGKIFVS